MNRRVQQNVRVDVTVAEKFSVIYMEIQTETYGIWKFPTRDTIWHLEDETRSGTEDARALCGQVLHNVCKSVSPALAMLGKPCVECTVIVRTYLTRAGVNHQQALVGSMVINDVNFRKNVHRALNEDLFEVNSPKKEEPKKRAKSKSK